MTPESLSLPRMRDAYQKETADLRLTFERSGDGSASLRRRSTLVDKVVRQLWTELAENQSDPTNVTVVATGGFGRKELFPYSDIDILFLCANDSTERDCHEVIRTCTQAMWDIGLRASPATRTYKECDHVDPDNLEFVVSLLDRRYLCGDYALFKKLENDLLPSLVLREWNTIVQNLAEMARARVERVGFEQDQLTVAQFEALRKGLPAKVELLPVSGMIERLRMVKDTEEIARIRAAGFALTGEGDEFSGIAAPVIDHDGNLVAALTLSRPYGENTRERRLELGGVVRAAAAAISKQLGHATQAASAPVSVKGSPHGLGKTNATNRI